MSNFQSLIIYDVPQPMLIRWEVRRQDTNARLRCVERTRCWLVWVVLADVCPVITTLELPLRHLRLQSTGRRQSHALTCSLGQNRDTHNHTQPRSAMNHNFRHIHYIFRHIHYILVFRSNKNWFVLNRDVFNHRVQ